MNFEQGKERLESKTEFIAHVRKSEDGRWAPPQLLARHLDETARLAEGFAARFQSGEWGKAAGFDETCCANSLLKIIRAFGRKLPWICRRL